MTKWLLPLGLVLLKDFPLGVVAEDAYVDEAAQVEPLGSELRHYGRCDGSLN